jgi:hypothetical protein
MFGQMSNLYCQPTRHAYVAKYKDRSGCCPSRSRMGATESSMKT